MQRIIQINLIGQQKHLFFIKHRTPKELFGHHYLEFFKIQIVMWLLVWLSFGITDQIDQIDKAVSTVKGSFCFIHFTHDLFFESSVLSTRSQVLAFN
jgi:hypothetical protein